MKSLMLETERIDNHGSSTQSKNRHPHLLCGWHRCHWSIGWSKFEGFPRISPSRKWTCFLDQHSHYFGRLKADDVSNLQASNQRRPATPDQVIAHLQGSRSELVLKKNSLEKKIAELENRRSPAGSVDEAGKTNPR